MGYGAYALEKNLIAICRKNPSMASWCILNCSRAVKMNEAGVAGGSEWSDEEDSEATNTNATTMMTYACNEGESLQEGRDFTNDLLQYLVKNMQEG